MKCLVLILLMIGFVSAVDIDFDCPDEIFVDEEFECSLEVFDGDGEYDVKIDLDGERNSVVEVWSPRDDSGEPNSGEWKSGYYYLIDFIEDGDEENIRMRVSKNGDWDGELKLRQGDKREFFDIEVEVVESEIVDEEDDEEVVSLNEVDEIVSLNDEVVEVDELIYVSKDARVVDWLPYGFSLFLIFVVGILLWERR